MRNNIELEADVIEEIQRGRKIQAIKRLRATRNIGLKEAKEYIEAYCLENDINNRDSAVIKSSNRNGGTFLIVLVISAYFIYNYFA